MSRVLVVATTFPQFEGDPRGAFILTHWEQRAAGGDHVRILAPHSAWCRGDLRTACHVQRVHYAPATWSTLTGNFGILENIRARPWRIVLVAPLWQALGRAIGDALDGWSWDAAGAHMLLPGGWLVAAACARRSIPFELFGHGTDVDVLMRDPSGIRRRFWRHASAARRIHLPSEAKKTQFCEAFGLSPDDPRLRVEAMVHCVPPPAMPPEPGPRRGTEILYLGRLIEQKGVDDLIEAMSMMRPRRPLHVAGDGPQRRRLQRLARRLGVEAHFHGFVAGEAKERRLERAAVLCVPSRIARGGLSEGSPLVVREALARGIPVVATAIGGIPELCRDDGRVRLVPAGSPRAFCDALCSVLEGSDVSDAALRRVC